MEKIREYLWLIRVNLIISTFTFGGGYVVVPMMRKYFVGRYFSEEDLLEMAAVAQSSPGAIAINLSVLVGRKAAGTAGFFIAFICGLLPPLVIIGVIAQFYTLFATNHIVNAVLTGMQAAVAALIVEVVVDMVQAIRKEKSWLLMAFVPASFIANAFLNVNVVVILVVCCGISLISVWKGKRI